jgi:hypothetical protein
MAVHKRIQYLQGKFSIGLFQQNPPIIGIQNIYRFEKFPKNRRRAGRKSIYIEKLK